MGKVFKEIFIFLLLIAVIICTLCMIFYDFFDNTQELPKVKEYIADSNVKATLQEIDANNEERGDSDSLLKSYEIVKADLKIYQVDGSYEKGNANPFEAYKTRARKEFEKGTGYVEVKDDDTTNSTAKTDDDDDKTTTTTNTNKTSSSTTTSTTNSSSTQGTLFEEPNSK